MLRTMNPTFWVVAIFLVILFLGIGIVIYRILCTSFYLKRIDSYTIEPEEDSDLSIIDDLERKLHHWKKTTSRFLSKYSFFRKYSERYVSYLREKDLRLAMDYVTTKFFLAVVSCLFYVIGSLLSIFLFSWIWVIATFLFGFLLPDFYWEYQRKNRIHRVEEDLWRAITVMGNSFQAGMSISQVLHIASLEIQGPLGEEFDQIIKDLQYGLDFETVLHRFYERCPVEEVHYMTTSLIIMNRTGGDILAIFRSIEDNFLARKRLRQEMKSATSSSSAIFKILVAMPFLIALFLLFLNPSFFSVFLTTPIGVVLLLLILTLYIIYILVIRQIMKIDD